MSSSVFLIARFTINTGVPVFQDVLIAGEYPVEQIGPQLQALLHREDASDYETASQSMFMWCQKKSIQPMDGRCWVWEKLQESQRLNAAHWARL